MSSLFLANRQENQDCSYSLVTENWSLISTEKSFPPSVLILQLEGVIDMFLFPVSVLEQV